MKVKFTFLMAAFLLSGLMSTFAQVDFSTAQGYANGELFIQTPTGGMTWSVAETGFLVDATAGTVTMADTLGGNSLAKYSQPFLSTATTFTMAIKFRFNRLLELVTPQGHAVLGIGFYAAGGAEGEAIELNFIRPNNTNNYRTFRISSWVPLTPGTKFTQSSLFQGPAIGFADDNDLTSDDITMKVTITKGATVDSWSATGKAFDALDVEIATIDYVAFTVSEGFHASSSYYAGFKATKPESLSKANNRTVKTFTASPLAPIVPSGIDVLGTDAGTIYPNPVVDVLNISSSDFTNIEIFNISGKLVKSVKLNGSPVDVSELAKGLYLVKLNGSTTAMSKFVKK